MSDIKQAFGTANQGITITLNSLASSGTAGRESTAVDNTSNLFLDALVTVKITLPSSGTPADSKAVYVYAYGTADGGTTYSDDATGSDAAFTHTDPPNLKLIGIINAPVIDTAYVGGPFSVAAAFGGNLPAEWGIIVRNHTGVTLASSGNSAHYQGVYATVA